ncbi:MAG: ATP-dependent Clp protease ATP-binding subunit, partial [Ruminococcus sp.]|nr:ATP-dependent Clp protease ATP-binding subunit [Ruminococcus sp.]
MMMCSKCKKRMAVIFITSVQGNEKKNEGLCLACAREQRIPQVSEFMDKFDITDEKIDQLSDQMMNMFDNDSFGNSFEMGGAGTIPEFLSDISKEDGMPDFPSLFGMPSMKPDSEEPKKSIDGKPDRRSIFGGNRREKKP